MKTRPASLMPEGSLARAPQPVIKKSGGKETAVEFFRVNDGPKNHQAPNKIGPFNRPQGDFFLNLGDEISSAEYDIRALKNRGCKLEPIDPPGWWMDQQKAAVARAEELREAGIDVPDAELHLPAPLAKKGQKTEAAAPDGSAA